jgi:hypothetical protein
MINVLPQSSFTMTNPNTNGDIESVVLEVSRLIRAASPFLDSIEFINKTKHCTIDIAFNRGKVQVIFRNPVDEQFDLNEMENPVIPLQITGR